jgi:trigger factor
MPSGIPVATVAINGGANAGILAAKILATSDDAILAKLKEYKEDLKKELKQKKEMAAYNEVEEKVIAKVVENASMDVPSAMIDTQVRSMADDFANRLRMQGITIEQYFQFTGLTQESLFADLRPQAEKQVKSRLVLEAVVKAENITVSEEELEEELKDIADKYKMPVEKVKEIIVGEERESLKRDIEVKKASELIVEAAKEI